MYCCVINSEVTDVLLKVSFPTKEEILANDPLFLASYAVFKHFYAAKFVQLSAKHKRHLRLQADCKISKQTLNNNLHQWNHIILKSPEDLTDHKSIGHGYVLELVLS